MALIGSRGWLDEKHIRQDNLSFSRLELMKIYCCRIVRLRGVDDALEMPMLFVDKVAGAPVSSTVDNYHENMICQVQRILQPNSPPLHLSSRLDTCTSGIECLIFSKLFVCQLFSLYRYPYIRVLVVIFDYVYICIFIALTPLLPCCVHLCLLRHSFLSAFTLINPIHNYSFTND